MTKSLFLTLGVFAFWSSRETFAQSGNNTKACQQFYTVGECLRYVDEVIRYDYMNNDPDQDTFTLCQLACDVEPGCNYFRYDGKLEQCHLLRYHNPDNCYVVTGTYQPGLDECLVNELSGDGCDAFRETECTLDRNQELIVFPVGSPEECEEEFRLVGTTYAASMWEFNLDRSGCTFYGQPTKTCKGAMGPLSPSASECFPNQHGRK